MSRHYTTTQGDMWDSIAYAQMGSTDYTGQLMQANQVYLRYYSFPAGVVLTLPDVAEAVDDAQPLWKGGEG